MPPLPSSRRVWGGCRGSWGGQEVQWGTRPALRSRSYPHDNAKHQPGPLTGPWSLFIAPTDKGRVELGLYVYLEQTRAIQAGVFNAPWIRLAWDKQDQKQPGSGQDWAPRDIQKSSSGGGRCSGGYYFWSVQPKVFAAQLVRVVFPGGARILSVAGMVSQVSSGLFGTLRNGGISGSIRHSCHARRVGGLVSSRHHPFPVLFLSREGDPEIGRRG